MLIHIRKMMYGDYNADGYPDICLLGHGYDIDPWGGEYPIILMSSPSGIFKENRYTDYVSFYHGGSQGDFDNDGDLDIFILGNFGHSALMINDGWGNFTIDESKVNPDLFVSMFNTEFYDLDHDGYLDLIMGGHDWEDDSYYHGGDTSYSNTPIVVWGNGITFNTDDYVRLPETNNEGFGIVCDYYFKDLNNDGNDEIILSRTGDGVRGGVSFYEGRSIQILECKGRDFKDVTSLYFDNLNDTYQSDRKDNGWIVWLDIQEINGINCLIGCFDTPDTPTPKALFEFSSGKFTRIKGIDIVKPSQGLLLYADSYNIIQAGNSVGSSLLNTSSNDYTYLGTGSIHIKDTWHDYFDVGFAFPYYVDFTNLIEQNYYLEFFIKNSDPSLMLEIKIETESGYYIEEPPRYFYNLSTEDIHHDGTWEAVRIPLNDFSIWNAPANENHWNKIKKISIIPVSEKGKELFLDEIRIRKIADINN